MWTDLFLENADNLGHELDILIDALGEYRAALRDNDAPRLEKLLAEGRMLKEEVDGR
jgi:prephenate dehydrogenase